MTQACPFGAVCFVFLFFVMASTSAADYALAATQPDLRKYLELQGVPAKTIDWYLDDCRMASARDFVAWFVRADYEEDIRKQLEAKFTVGASLKKEDQRFMVMRSRIAYLDALNAQKAKDAKAEKYQNNQIYRRS